TEGKPLWLFCEDQYALFGPTSFSNMFAELIGDVLDLSPPSVLKKGRTNSNGNFLVKGLPVGWGRLWATSYGNYYSHTGLVDIREGFTTAGLELRLKPLEECWKVEVMVLDPEGKPYAEAEVHYEFKSEGGSMRAGGPVDEQGCFRNTQFSSRLMKAREEGRVPGYFTFVADDLTYRYGSVRLDHIPLGARNVALKLKPHRPCFTLNPEKHQGETVSQLSVKIEADCDLFDKTLNLERNAENPDAYSIPIPLASFDLKISSHGFATVHAGPFTPETVPDLLDIQFEPLAGIHGRIRAGEMACPEACITLHKAVDPNFLYTIEGIPSLYERKAAANAVTNKEGDFTLYTDKPGLFYVRAEKSGWAAADYGPIMIDPDEGLMDFELKLEEPCVIQGSVTASPAQNVAGIVVAATRHDAFPITTRTDMAGRYTLENLAPGRWQVMLWHQDIVKDEEPCTVSTLKQGLEENPEFRDDCVVAPGTTTSYDLSLSPEAVTRACNVQGQLLINSRAPTGWNVSLKRAGAFPLSASFIESRLDRSGRFSLASETPGVYTLCLFGSAACGNTVWVLDEVTLHSGNAFVWNLNLSTGTYFSTGDPARNECWYKWLGDDGLEAYTRLSQESPAGVTVPAGSGCLVDITPLLVYPFFLEEVRETFFIEADGRGSLRD
ncbi:MAG: carboxypeptidase-like regulatory domain-containing protein, partial [Planctomycetota bacterium]